jgi:two-component system CAI-1 autoinducer sensor kinase/phosphatase CqsS
MWADRLLSELAEAAEQSKQYSERHFRAFGYIGLVIVPATTIIEESVADPHFDTIYARLVAAFAGAVLLSRRVLPRYLRSRFDLVWISLTTIALPVCYGIILNLNAALTPIGQSVQSVWVYQYLVAIFIFVQLTHHALLTIVLWLVALVPVFATLLLVDTANTDALVEAWIIPLPVYLTALIVGSFANRNIQVIERERIRAASAVGSMIAHELRTPLASIGLLTRAVRRHLPMLVDAYESHLAATRSTPALSGTQMVELRRALVTIRGEVDYSNTVIDMLLANTSTSPLESSLIDEFFASQAIAEAVNRYPYNNTHEQSILTSSIQSDFLIRAPYLLIVHVLFNLMKNAIYYAQRNPNGTVKVFSGVYRGRPSLVVSDTGCGVSDSLRTKVFDHFFTTTEAGQGAGIGLSFCKMVMEGIGGEIVCDSKEGEYTTFRLLFPEVS